MRITKIKMTYGNYYSNNLLEIDELYISGCTNPGWFKKSLVHDYVKSHKGSIQVNIYPYPDIEPMVSIYGEKYVRSTPDSTRKDNLLNLPRE